MDKKSNRVGVGDTSPTNRQPDKSPGSPGPGEKTPTKTRTNTGMPPSGKKTPNNSKVTPASAGTK